MVLLVFRNVIQQYSSRDSVVLSLALTCTTQYLLSRYQISWAVPWAIKGVFREAKILITCLVLIPGSKTKGMVDPLPSSSVVSFKQ